VASLFPEILRHLRAGETVALCTVVSARGSTPQQHGAKMAVFANGQTLGTLGGGCVEAEVRTQAIQLLPTGQSKTSSFRLDHDYGWDDGLICGGIMDIYIDVLSDAASAAKIESICNAISKRQPIEFAISYSTEDGEQKYHEELLPAPNLVIAGAGHVGCALAELMAKLDFELTIIDDRPDLLSEQRFPTARRIIGEIETELVNLPIDPQTYIVIVTRGHRHDGRALAAVIESPAHYVGLIGSRKKVRTILSDLHDNGIPLEKLLKVHAPIGLEIGAISPNEIAVSIAAELIASRHGRCDEPAKPMKITAESLQSWLARKSPH
jgi:xanthine dehydrogenase accessory factor